MLTQAFARLSNLYRKTEAILSKTTSSEDPTYNTALARLQSLVSAPWSQQVIAAEAMKFDFQFLSTVYTFWRKVISQKALNGQQALAPTNTVVNHDHEQYSVFSIQI